MEQIGLALVGGLIGTGFGIWASFRIERQRHDRQAKAALRILYLELRNNLTTLHAARDGLPYGPLHREAWDLLATSIAEKVSPADLALVALAYTLTAWYDISIDRFWKSNQMDEFRSETNDLLRELEKARDITRDAGFSRKEIEGLMARDREIRKSDLA